jgi:hypothetical protein
MPVMDIRRMRMRMLHLGVDVHMRMLAAHHIHPITMFMPVMFIVVCMRMHMFQVGMLMWMGMLLG